MAAKKRSNGLLKYTTYNFVDKDPIIDVLRTAKRDKDMTDGQISAASRVSATTLRNWFKGDTKRPQFATAAAAAVAMGMDSLPITAEARRKLRGG
jgi:hypothetical protein